jgi:hypothetical protein
MTPEQARLLKQKVLKQKEPEAQTSVEIGGITFTGGKMFAILTALSTAAGGVWGGALLWQDYMDMKDQISSYVAPDLSGFQEQISVMDERMTTVETSVEEARTYTRDIKTDLRSDIDRLEKIVESAEDRTKSVQDEAFTAIRKMEEDTRNVIDTANERFDNKRDALNLDTERKMKELEERLDNKIQRALDNPLAN